MPVNLLRPLALASLSSWLVFPALASPPLATCLSREQVAVTVDDEIQTLEVHSDSASRRRATSSKVQVWLRSFGAGVTPMGATPMELSATLDDAKRRQSTLLLHIVLQGEESRLSHPYLVGDQYPLRTVRLVLATMVIDTTSREILSSFEWPASIYARHSVEEALGEDLSQNLARKLSEALTEACGDRVSHRQRTAKAPPAPPTAKQKAERDDQINQFIRACVAGGSRSEVVAEGSAAGEFSLRRLLANGHIGAEIRFNKSSAEMLVDGITNRMNETAAREADAVRACLKPMRDWMARTYFQ